MLGNRGITPPRAWNKGDRDNSPQRVPTRDLVDLARQARVRALTGSQARVLAGSRSRVLAGTPAGARTRIQTQARASKSTSVGIVSSNIPTRLQYKQYLVYSNRLDK